MVESKMQTVDRLNDVLSDLKGAADALTFKATVEGDNMAFMITRVIDSDVDLLEAVVEWVEGLEQ